MHRQNLRESKIVDREGRSTTEAEWIAMDFYFTLPIYLAFQFTANRLFYLLTVQKERKIHPRYFKPLISIIFSSSALPPFFFLQSYCKPLEFWLFFNFQFPRSILFSPGGSFTLQCDIPPPFLQSIYSVSIANSIIQSNCVGIMRSVAQKHWKSKCVIICRQFQVFRYYSMISMIFSIKSL